MENLQRLIQETRTEQKIYQPVFFRTENPDDKEKLQVLLKDSGKVTYVHDELYGQLKELMKCQHPTRKIKPDEYEAMIAAHLNGRDMESYGVWIYYPWRRTLVHILDEEEFVLMRTNRNQYKITMKERDMLASRKIGVVGLSVGQSIALTLAMERTAGELRLADFDELELSNLNRIRAGVHSLGLSKVVIAAREIAEIDPYLKVRIFSDGLHKDNIDAFFLENGKLDLLVEVCDGLDIKIESRFKARELGIPVVMDTNDRGMLDVERFDLEPERPILHGLAVGLNPENIKQLSNEEKIPYILKMVGADSISTRMKASMLEVEQSITTWPQLASSVVLGGALTTDVARRILLDQYHGSGRFYIDFEELVGDPKPETGTADPFPVNPYQPLQRSEMEQIMDQYLQKHPGAGPELPAHDLDLVMDAAVAAPSAGNNQPWKWAWRKGSLFLFHDRQRSWSWGDYAAMGAHMGLGTAIENVRLKAAALGRAADVRLLPVAEIPNLIAVMQFPERTVPATDLETLMADHIFSRSTNRKLGGKEPLPEAFYAQLDKIAETLPGSSVRYITDDFKMARLGHIIAECDKIRLLNRQGHDEFYHEIRWTHDDAEKTRDGIEIAAVDLTQSEIAGFRVSRDWQAMELLSQWKAGNALKRMSVKTVGAASSMLLIAIPEFSPKALLETGQLAERIWLYAQSQQISMHPMLSPAFFLNKLSQGDLTGFTEENIALLKSMKIEFMDIFNMNDEIFNKYAPVFLLKLSKAPFIGVSSFRKPKEELFFNFDK